MIANAFTCYSKDIAKITDTVIIIYSDKSALQVHRRISMIYLIYLISIKLIMTMINDNYNKIIIYMC